LFPLKPMYEKLRRTIALGEDTTGMLMPDPELVEVQVISDEAEGNLERKVDKREIGVEGAKQAEGDLVADTAKQGGVPPVVQDAPVVQVAPGSVLSKKKSDSKVSKQQVYEVPGGHMVYGTFVKKCKTTRPIDILPDFWVTLSVKRRQELIDEYPARQAKRLAEEPADNDEGEPAVVAQQDYFFPRMPLSNNEEPPFRSTRQWRGPSRSVSWRLMPMLARPCKLSGISSGALSAGTRVASASGQK